MKIYQKQNVFDAALNRIRMLFDEFDEVIVGYSGGKDSTVCLELGLIVAKEKNKLPLKVMFIDQESEWQGTMEMVTDVMTRPEVQPMWFQMPISMTNNTSSYSRFAECWAEGNEENYVHERHPLSIRENKYGTKRFHELFGAIMKVEFAGKKACYISGVRTEENPKRYVALTYAATYKYITWAKRLNQNQEHYTFYPIYDWSIKDVWKAINEHAWKYNKVYDELYRRGYGLNEMRVSNLHHETALQTLMKVQEIEPETWLKIQSHIEGANTIKHLKEDAFQCPRELPYMFESWEQYARYLADVMIVEQEHRDLIVDTMNKQGDTHYFQQPIKDEFFRVMIKVILSSDWDLTKFTNWTMRQDVYGFRTFLQGRRDKKQLMDLKFFNHAQLIDLLKSLNIDIDEYEKNRNTRDAIESSQPNE